MSQTGSVDDSVTEKLLNDTVKSLTEENICLKEENQSLKAALRQTNIALSSQMRIFGALESQVNENYEVLARQLQCLELVLKKRERLDPAESSNVLKGSSNSELERDQLAVQVAELELKLHKSTSSSRTEIDGDIAKLISIIKNNERLLKEKHKKILFLESRISQLEIENEAIEILKSQAMVYMTEYAELQAMNKELCQQSTSLKEELRKLNVTRKLSTSSIAKVHRSRRSSLDRFCGSKAVNQ